MEKLRIMHFLRWKNEMGMGKNFHLLVITAKQGIAAVRWENELDHLRHLRHLSTHAPRVYIGISKLWTARR